MKILIIEPCGKRGLCQYTHNLANAIAIRNHQVLLATAIEFETKNLPRRYEAIEVFNRFSINPFRLLHFFRSVKKIKPDIIHIQGAIHPSFYLILWKILKIITRSRFMYTSHEIFPKKKKIYHPYVLKQIYQGMSHVIVHAQQNKEQLIQKFQLKSEKVSVLSIGNNLAFSESLKPTKKIHIPKGKKVILFFGIIESHKGLMTLIRAFSEIKENVHDAFLLIVGQPFEDISKYLKEIKQLKIEDSVKLELDYIPIHEIPNVFKIAHLVVLPYNQVSQSGVVLSAYSFGKPVVATSVGGMAEIVNEGKTGLLIPPDNPKALAKAVIRLLKDDVLREKMGKKALEIVQKNHSWDTIAEKTELIYRSLLNQKSQSILVKT